MNYLNPIGLNPPLVILSYGGTFSRLFHFLLRAVESAFHQEHSKDFSLHFGGGRLLPPLGNGQGDQQYPLRKVRDP